MEAIITFFITPWVFITVISIFIIIELFMAEYEKFGWNTAIIILMLVLIQWKYNIFDQFMDRPLMYFLYTVGYIVVGIIWSFAKWYSKLSKHAREIKKVKKERGEEWNDPEFAQSIANELPQVYLHGSDNLTKAIENSFPQLNDNKATISGWIIYWPFSLVATFLNDPVRRFANYLTEVFHGVYAKIQEKVIKSI